MIRFAVSLLCIAVLSMTAAADSLVVSLSNGESDILSKMDLSFYREHQKEILDSINALPPVERRRATLLLMQWDFMKFKAGNVDVSEDEMAKDVSEIQELADSVATDVGGTYPEMFLYPAFRKPYQIAWIGMDRPFDFLQSCIRIWCAE